MKITSEYVHYNKASGNLIVSSEFLGGSFPEEIEITSRNTGRTVRYIVNIETAMKNEFWDGEVMVYFAPEDRDVPRLTVVHEY